MLLTKRIVPIICTGSVPSCFSNSLRHLSGMSDPSYTVSLIFFHRRKYVDKAVQNYKKVKHVHSSMDFETEMSNEEPFTLYLTLYDSSSSSISNDIESNILYSSFTT